MASEQTLGTIRASSLSDLMDCPHRWEAKYLRGITSPKSGAAHLGTSIHAGTAVFDTERLGGGTGSVSAAADAFIERLHQPKEEVQWDDDLGLSAAEKIGLNLTSRYCVDFAPARQYSHVELSFDSLSVGTQHGVLTLTGTADRVRKLSDGREGIADIKTGARAVGADGRAVTKNHAAQLGIYQLLAERALGHALDAPAEIVGMSTGSTARIGTGEIPGAKECVLGTEDEPGMIEMAALMLKSGLFHSNPRSMLCSGKFCPIYPCRAVGRGES